MKSELRDRVGDLNTVAWSDAQLYTKLYLAAQQIANQLSANNGVPFGRSTYSVVATGTTSLIPLLGVTDYLSPREMLDTSANSYKTRWIDPREFDGYRVKYPDGCDDRDRILYTTRYKSDDTYRVTCTSGGTFTLTFNSQTTGSIADSASASTIQTALEGLSSITAGEVEVTAVASGGWDIRFISTKGARRLEQALTQTGDATVSKYEYEVEFIVSPGRTFTHVFNQRVTKLTGDAESYSIIPSEYHERIIALAAEMCLGPMRSTATDFTIGYERMLRKDSEEEINHRPSPGMVT